MSSPNGNTAREERQRANREASLSSDVSFPIGIKTPLQPGKRENESLFKMNFEIKSQLKDNLKNLLMTKKGEKLCFPDYGTNLFEIYSSNLSKDEIYDFAMNEINESVAKYMPSITLSKFYSKKLVKTNLVDAEETKDHLRNKEALEFYNAQNNIAINGNDITLNTDNPNIDEIYEITVNYVIPNISQKETESLSIFLRTSK